MHEPPFQAEPQPPRPALRASTIALGFVIGVVLVVVGAFVLLVVGQRESLVEVTEQRLDEAVDLWQRNGPASYDLEVVLSGSQTGQIRIEVRDHEVTAMVRDGVVPAQRRTWDYWSVVNQFEMIRQDLESADDPQRAFGVGSPSQVVLRADFDAELGYPRVYHRIILGARHELRWDIVHFRAIAE